MSKNQRKEILELYVQTAKDAGKGIKKWYFWVCLFVWPALILLVPLPDCLKQWPLAVLFFLTWVSNGWIVALALDKWIIANRFKED